jgi:hypothetical protein
VSLRVFLLFFAILAMVLSGFHGGRPASIPTTSRVFDRPGAALVPGTRLQLPGPLHARHCHTSHARTEYALATPSPEIESPRSEWEREPSPWPHHVLQDASLIADGVPAGIGGPGASLPHGLPPPLARICVLRI